MLKRLGLLDGPCVRLTHPPHAGDIVPVMSSFTVAL
jgi:hypothetical protein